MFEYFIMLVIILSLAELAARIGLFKPNWMPIVNLAIAFIICSAYFGSSYETAATSILLGFIATGLYSTVYQTFVMFTIS